MTALPKYDVLHFSFDKDHGCSLTVLANSERFHVTVDPKELKDRSKKGKEIQRAYMRLLAKAKAAEQSGEDEEAPSSSENGTADEQDTNDTACPEQERDSAVDVSTPEIDEQSDKGVTTTDPIATFHNWILTPLAQHMQAGASKSKTSLQDWYHTPIQYYKLSTASGKVQARKDSSPAWALRDRLNELLIPTVDIPNKTIKLRLPQISATDVAVISCAADPAPFHPVLVSHKGKEYFFKPVDTTQPGPTIREIHLLHAIAEKGLHSREDFRCPQLKGLVYFSPEEPNQKSSKGESKHIAALLLTPIANPTPLTRLLDCTVPEHQRIQWAKDAERMVEVLHENDIVWGDAKGDNFLVDGEEKVWIIDFGGSYTEGWVDANVKETEEGDWMGTEKVLNALEDPVNGIEHEDVQSAGGGEEHNEETEGKEEEKEKRVEEEVDEEDEEGAQKQGGSDKYNPDSGTSSPRPSSRKRSHHAVADTNETRLRPTKQQKHSSGGGMRDSTYCLCDGVSSGRMLACDGKECKREWFHFECLGIEEAPEQKEWFCEECRA